MVFPKKVLDSFVSAIFTRPSGAVGVLIALGVFVGVMVLGLNLSFWSDGGKEAGRSAVRELRYYFHNLPSKKYKAGRIRYPASPYGFGASRGVDKACSELGQENPLCKDFLYALDRANEYETNPTPELRDEVEMLVAELEVKFKK